MSVTAANAQKDLRKDCTSRVSVLGLLCSDLGPTQTQMIPMIPMIPMVRAACSRKVGVALSRLLDALLHFVAFCCQGMEAETLLPSALLCAASSTPGLVGRDLLAQQLVAELEGDGSTS